MSKLNKKNGNLRGVSLQYAALTKNGDRDYTKDWITGLPVQGWYVWHKKKHRFDLNFTVDGQDIEILLTAKALTNMLNAINKEQEPVLFSEKAGILNNLKSSSCTVEGCPCSDSEA